MRAALIGAGEESLHTIKKAQELGVQVTALDGNPAAAGLAAADEGLVVDISDEAAVLEVLGKRKPDFVITGPIGRFLTTAGAVNDAMHLTGISRQAAVLCTDKYLFHGRLAGQGLRDCHCFLIPGDCGKRAGKTGTGVDNLLEETRELGYPAILKPRYGSGSRGIFFLENEKELKEALEQLAEDFCDAEKSSLDGKKHPAEDYILEEAVQGTEYGVDAAMDSSSFQLILLRKKLLTPPPARQAVGYLSVTEERPENRELLERVRKYMEQVTGLLGLRDCLLHADLILSGERLFAIEVSARPSGHYLHNLFTPMATGVDMAEAYIRSRCGLPYSYRPAFTKSLLIRYFDLKPGRVRTVPDREQLTFPENIHLRDWQCNLQPGEVLAPVTTGHSVMGRGYFILEGKPEEALTAAAAAAEACFSVED